MIDSKNTPPPSPEIIIQDLIQKIQLLSRGLLQERKKSQTYLQRLKDYEMSLQLKDSEIANLSKEKFELKSKLTIEKNKTIQRGRQNSATAMFSKAINKEEVLKKLEDEVNELKFTNKDLTARLMDERENFDQQKIKFQTLITLQGQNVQKKDEEIKELRSVNINLEEKVQSLNRLISNFERDNASFDEKSKNLKIERENLAKKLKQTNDILQNFKNISDNKDNEIKNLKKQLSDYAKMLTAMKNDSVSKLLSPKTFRIERLKQGVGHKKQLMNLTFQKNEENGAYEIIFKKDNEKKEEHVNLLDFSTFEVQEKEKNKVKIVYTYEGQEINATLTIHELLFDYFFQTYREFNKKANELY